MPIYKYRCVNPECGVTEEVVHSMHETTDFRCQLCYNSMDKVPCTTSFKLLGKDWPGKNLKKGD